MQTGIKVETPEEFMARGGKVERFPYIEPDEQREHVLVKTKIDIDKLSLAEGAFYFSKKNTPRKVSVIKKINMKNIPEHIQKLIRESVNDS